MAFSAHMFILDGSSLHVEREIILGITPGIWKVEFIEFKAYFSKANTHAYSNFHGVIFQLGIRDISLIYIRINRHMNGITTKQELIIVRMVE